MRGGDKVRMPSSTAGITTYWDEVKTRVELKPAHVIALAVLIIILEIFLQLYGASFFS
jgi:preprotein translocase subunit Sec61beta